MIDEKIKDLRFRKPSFLIIGAQKSGTTSLYANLVQHPQIVTAKKKEIHFFDNKYERGMDWYASRFPPVGRFEGLITGEATPRYLFLPHVPQRVRRDLPDVKLIVILRNPVDRAYSHYYHNFRKNRLQGSFEDALQQSEDFEKQRSGNSSMAFWSGDRCSFDSYLARGMYAEQLERWFEFFPRERFLILKSDDFFRSPGSILSQIHAFLGVPPFQCPRYIRQNSYTYRPMNPATRTWLEEYFRPHNQRLYKLLGTDFQWEGAGR